LSRCTWAYAAGLLLCGRNDAVSLRRQIQIFDYRGRCCRTAHSMMSGAQKKFRALSLSDNRLGKAGRSSRHTLRIAIAPAIARTAVRAPAESRRQNEYRLPCAASRRHPGVVISISALASLTNHATKPGHGQDDGPSPLIAAAVPANESADTNFTS